jgi:phosphoglycolate phosphatase
MTIMAPGDITAVVFDKDGTLFDFAATWNAWASGLLARLSGGDNTRAVELAGLIGFDLVARRFLPDSLVIAGTPDEIVAVLHPALPSMSKDLLLETLNDEASNAPMAEAIPLAPFLDLLKRNGLRIGVATNDAYAPALAHLDAAGVTARFDFVAGSDSGYGAKPEPGQLLAFCEWVGVAPEQTLMVGDSTHDLIAGRAAGMRCAAVLTGMAPAAVLAPFADVVLPDIGHLPDWLGLR